MAAHWQSRRAGRSAVRDAPTVTVTGPRRHSAVIAGPGPCISHLNALRHGPALRSSPAHARPQARCCRQPALVAGPWLSPARARRRPALVARSSLAAAARSAVGSGPRSSPVRARHRPAVVAGPCSFRPALVAGPRSSPARACRWPAAVAAPARSCRPGRPALVIWKPQKV